MPLSTASWSALSTLGLVGVMAMAFTPWVTIDSMAAIWPSSSVPLSPWANSSSASGWPAFHSLAASTIVS